MNSDLRDPLVAKESIGSYDNDNECRNRHSSHSDELISSSRKFTTSSNTHSTYSYRSKESSSLSSSTDIEDSDNFDIHIDHIEHIHSEQRAKYEPLSYDDDLPEDVVHDAWRSPIEELLDFDEEIDDKTLAKKLKNKAYSSRSFLLQQICEALPRDISDSIISYELSSKSVEIYIRRSMIYNVLNKFNLKAFISGWILTFIGFYLFLCGLNLFNLFNFVGNDRNKLIYFIGNYSEIGWRIELSIVLALCTIHFLCIIGVYNTGRKWSKKLNRVKHVLHFRDAENCGEAYIPALKWLGFPFIEAFNLNFKWFFLLGFKYWIMVVIFIVLCLPFWVFEANWLWLIISIPSCILCWIGAWLQLVTFNNRNNWFAAIKDLFKILIMCIIVFSILYGIVWLMGSNHHNEQSDNNHHNGITAENITQYALNGNFNILNLMLAAMFVVVLLCVELRIIASWESVNVRYHYFGWQLLASILIVLIFGILGLNLFVMISVALVMYNAAIIWNDLMHKKIMQTTYGINKTQYVDRYRPINNTDTDSEWLTAIFTICCSKNRINQCRGRWVINCYAGLVTGRITTPTYLL